MEITFHAIIKMCTFKTALYDVEIFAEFKRGQKVCPAAALCRVEGREARPLGSHLCFSEVISECFWRDSILCKVHRKMFHRGGEGVKELLKKKKALKLFLAKTKIPKKKSVLPP